MRSAILGLMRKNDGCRAAATKAMFLLVAALMFAANSARGQGIPDLDLGAVESKKTVDRRSDKTPEAWRMAVFFARNVNAEEKAIGHAYVALLTYRDDIEGFVTDRVFGLYPDQSPKWILNVVPGGINLKPEDQFPDAALLVWINPDMHAAIGDAADKFDAEGEYQLVAKDCVSLMAKAAELADLTRPSLALHPYTYLSELARLND